MDEELLLEWLSGRWTGTHEGTHIEEFWTQGAGGTLLGCSKSHSSGRTDLAEFLFVEKKADGVLLTIVLPMTHRTIHMHVTAMDDRHVVFSDASASPPDRLTYSLKPDNSLDIALEKPSKKFSVRFHLTRA